MTEWTFVSLSTDFTDVTLVSDDTYGRQLRILKKMKMKKNMKKMKKMKKAKEMKKVKKMRK